MENYECDQLEEFCKKANYDFDICMGELMTKVNYKVKENGVDVKLGEIVNDSMYMRPKFSFYGNQGSSRQRFRPDMRKYQDVKIRFRAKDPNDPHLYRNKTPGGTVFDRSRSRSEDRRNRHEEERVVNEVKIGV